jgi:hypothetical protein
MFASRYRSMHEAQSSTILPDIAGYLNGTLPPEDLNHALAARDQLELEVDVAPFLNNIVPELVMRYPDAKFVVTIRHCFDWLDSRLEHNYATIEAGVSPIWQNIREAEYSSIEADFGPEDRHLRELGLYPVRAYLRRWVIANERALSEIPAARILVVRTEDLDHAVSELETFVGARRQSVRVAKANVRTSKRGLMARIPRSFLVSCAEEVGCTTLMERYWGESWRDPTCGCRILGRVR